MWQFDLPWLLLLLPLPWLAWRYLPAYRESRSALRVPFFAAMSRAVGQEPSRGGAAGGRWQLPLNLLVWGLVLVACARPVLVEKPIERVRPIRDLMLAIDISQSMETNDYLDAGGQRVDRLSIVKGVVRDFIGERKDDRIGLIVFGTGAFAQAPPTLDQITPHQVKTLSHQPKRDLFWVPLGAALALLVLSHLLAAIAGRLAVPGDSRGSREVEG